MPQKHILLKFIIFILFNVIINNIYALSSDESKPVQIDANNATADQVNMTVVLTGNVIITRGSIYVHGDKGISSQDKDSNKIITLYGSPITFSQLQDDGQKITGQCNTFTYNTQTNLAILTGRAQIKKGKDNVSGEQITYNTKTQIYSANGLPRSGINKKQSGRVTIILDKVENGK